MTLSRKIFIKSVFLAILFFIVVQANAQKNTEMGYYKEKYPTANKVSLNKELIVDIVLDNDDILITQTSIDEDLFLNESATQQSKESVNYSSFFQLEKIEASSYSFENGKYYENKVKEFRKKDELNGSFYDDVKSVNFIYPKLSQGSKTKLLVKEKLTNPRFLNGLFFGGYYPVINAKLVLRVDKNVELDFKTFNTDSINIEFTKTKKRNKIIYTWVSKDAKPIKMEDGTPNFRNYYPHVIPIIKQYKTKNNKIIKLTSGVADLYGWYFSLTKDINKEPIDKDLVELTNGLIKDKETEIEKVRAIYYWVQNNIKYIAFEYALGGFIPREANDIYQKKYGDCKDNSSILYEMLKIAGIKGNLTWIGTRKIPYKYNELPTPSVDNHMILNYETEDRHYFLDATGRYIPLELPTSFIQGKEALIGKGSNGFEIVEVPIIEANKNAIIDTSFVEIDAKILKGKGSKRFKGYQKIDIFNDLEPLITETKIKEYYNDILQKGNNKFILKSVYESNKYNYDNDFKVDYDFTISDYIVATTRDIYVNLNLDKILLKNKIEGNRKTDIEVDYKKMYSFVNELSIPEGYIINYLPKGFKAQNEFVSVIINYSQKGNKITYQHEVKFDFLLLPKNHHKTYTELLKKVEKAYKEVIILRKIKE